MQSFLILFFQNRKGHHSLYTKDHLLPKHVAKWQTALYKTCPLRAKQEMRRLKMHLPPWFWLAVEMSNNFAQPIRSWGYHFNARVGTNLCGCVCSCSLCSCVVNVSRLEILFYNGRSPKFSAFSSQNWDCLRLQRGMAGTYKAVIWNKNWWQWGLLRRWKIAQQTKNYQKDAKQSEQSYWDVRKYKTLTALDPVAAFTFYLSETHPGCKALIHTPKSNHQEYNLCKCPTLEQKLA